MINSSTLTHLRALKLNALAEGLELQAGQPEALTLSFEERLALLVDREVYSRQDRKRARLLHKAQLKYPDASIEAADFTGISGLDRRALTALALSSWIERGDTILFGGATGVGKTWLGCALAQYACRRGHGALHLRVPRLAEELRILHGQGGFAVWLAALARTEVLVLDASMSAQGKTLTLLSPGIVRSGLGQITNLLETTDGAMFVGMVTELLGKADPAKDTRILRAPAYDTNYRATQSTVDPAWLATVSGVSTTTTTFEAALTALITSSTVTPASRINLEACLDPVNVRVVFEVDFADGRKDGNCDVISRFRWVRDEPGKTMFFVGGFHKESPIQDPELDAQMSNSGGWVPNQVQMYDDGTNGDGVAGDNVWTFAIALPRGSRIGLRPGARSCGCGRDRGCPGGLPGGGARRGVGARGARRSRRRPGWRAA